MGADQQIDYSNQGVMASLMRGIINHENGKSGAAVSDAQIAGGIKLGAAANGQVMARSANVTNTTTNDVQIGQINVQTQATDAEGMARGVRGALSSNQLLNNYSSAMAG